MRYGRSRQKLTSQASTFFKGCWKAVTAPWRWTAKSLSWLFVAIGKWWKQRQVKHLMRGIPALLLLGGAVYVIISDRATSDFQRGQRYLEAGDREFRAQRWSTASKFLGRAIELGLNSPDTRFRLAQAAQNNGDISRMVAILTELAPVDRPAYAPAHLWQATQLLSDATADRIQLAKTHLKYALALQPQNRVAHSLLGDLAFQMQDWDSAIFHLEQSDPVSARNNVQLCKALLLKNNRAQAVRFADRAQTAGRAEVLQNPDDVTARVALAEALLLQEKFEDALQVVSQGISRAPEELQLRTELARVYFMWSENLAVSTMPAKERDFQVFQLLARALEQDPDNLLIFDRIMKLLLKGGQIAQAGEQILLQNISAGVVPGVSHLLLGTFTDAVDRPEKAVFHLERAHALLKNAPIVSNNLAWHLMTQPAPDLKRALQLIDSVLQQHPDVPAFRETRGQILAKVENYQAALEDLEFALPHFREDLRLHTTLARVYEKLKIEDLADQHRKIAEILENTGNK